MVTVDVQAGCEDFAALLAELDPGSYSGADCAEVVRLLARVEKRCAGVRILFAARAVECAGYRGQGYSNPRTWLAQTTGVSSGQANQALETAAGLSACPETKEALLAGDLSLDQAAVIIKTEAVAPGSETDLLAQAATASLSRLADEGRRRRLVAADPGDAEAAHDRQRRERYARYWQDGDGIGHVAGSWPVETWVPLTNRIDAEVDAMLRQAKRDGVEPEPVERLRADAVARLINGGGLSRRPARPELVLVCDVAAFQRGHSEGGETCQVIGGGPVPVEVARELAVSAFIKGVLHDGKTIQQVAHFRGRYRCAELATALSLGPPPLFLGVACVDCGRRYGIEWDHIDPVAHGGATSYENVKPRCYACHRDKTERDRAAGLLTAHPPGNDQTGTPTPPTSPSPAPSSTDAPPPRPAASSAAAAVEARSTVTPAAHRAATAPVSVPGLTPPTPAGATPPAITPIPARKKPRAAA